LADPYFLLEMVVLSLNSAGYMFDFGSSKCRAVIGMCGIFEVDTGSDLLALSIFLRISL
jgi:hypothetical protein